MVRGVLEEGEGEREVREEEGGGGEVMEIVCQ